MGKSYYLVFAIVLCLTVAAELYFGVVFNESVRHALDAPAMLFVAPGLVLNHLLGLGLPFDGPSHSAVIWLSGLVYAAASVAVIAVVRRVWKGRPNQTVAGDS